MEEQQAAAAGSSARERFTVLGKDLVEKVRLLVHEGNIRRIIIRRQGKTILELPVTVAAIGVVLAPMLAAVGAVAAAVTHCDIEIERESQAATDDGA